MRKRAYTTEQPVPEATQTQPVSDEATKKLAHELYIAALHRVGADPEVIATAERVYNAPVMRSRLLISDAEQGRALKRGAAIGSVVGILAIGATEVAGAILHVPVSESLPIGIVLGGVALAGGPAIAFARAEQHTRQAQQHPTE